MHIQPPQFVAVLREQWLACLWVSAGFALALWSIVSVPPPGVSVGILAVVGIFVTFKTLANLEKAAWAVVITMLILAEVRSINKNEESNKNERELQISRLASIKQETDSLVSELKQQLLDNRKQYEDTITNLKATSSKADAAATNAMQSANDVTGGDSFALLVIEQSLLHDQRLRLLKVGDYPLYNLTITINNHTPHLTQVPLSVAAEYSDVTAFEEMTISVPELYNDLRRDDLKKLTPDFKVLTTADDDAKFVISFSARNGSWGETVWLHLDPVSHLWLQATEVYKEHFRIIDKHHGEISRQYMLLCIPKDFRREWIDQKTIPLSAPRGCKEDAWGETVYH